MSVLSLLDLAGVFFAAASFLVLVAVWKRVRYTGVRSLLLGLAGTVFLYQLCLFLEWSGVRPELNPYEDVLGALIPMWWLFILYSYVQMDIRQDLENSEESLRLTVDCIGDAVISTDTRGRVQRMNVIGEELTGWSRGETIGKPLDEVFCIKNARTGEVCENPVRKVLETGKVQGLANHTVLVSRQGREYQIADSAAPIEDYRGHIRGVVLVFRDVTERYQWEEKLGVERRRLAAAIEGTRAGTWEWNVKTGEVIVNERWAEMVGYSLPEISPVSFRTWEDMTHPEDLKEAHVLLDKHLRGEIPYYECEIRMRHREGAWIWVLDRGKISEWTENGEPLLISGTHQDITARKQAEKRLEESRRQLATLMDNLPGMAYRCLYDRHWTMKFASSGCLELTGYQPQDVLDNKKVAYAELIHWRDRDRVQNEVQAALEAGGHFEVEYWLYSAKGEWKYVWEKGVGIYENGCLLVLEGFVTDITDRKKAEEELRRTRDRINYHIYNSPLAVIEWEKGRHITGWSPRAEAMFGWKAEEVLGKNWGDFDFVHPEDWEYTQENIKKLFDGLTTFNKISNRNICKDGTVLYCEWYNSALLDAEGRMESILSLVADVTQIRAAKEKAEAANRAKSEFLANMSHEIRTPLNGITGMLQLLSDSSADAEQIEYVEMARKSTKRLNRLLTDILDLSRIEANKLEIRWKSFKPREVMQAIADVFAHAARENNNTLNEYIGENIPESLVGDETRLTQILFNLVGNACKYTENGRVEASAALLPETKENTRHLLFMITDTGSGIPADKLQAVFETFTQAGESDSPFTRQYEGAGLGLPLVKRLTHLMGGTLCISTEKGEGTEVYVSIPFTVDDGPDS